MTANGYEVSFEGVENVIKLDYGDGCTSLNILKCIELYPLQRRMLWYANYTSIKLLKKKKQQSSHTKYPLRTTGPCAIYALSPDSLQRSCKDPYYYTHSAVEETDSKRHHRLPTK